MNGSDVDWPAGPVADRLVVWPMDDGRYGFDAVFQGTTGYERADRHRNVLDEASIKTKLLQGLDDTWSLRFGPYPATVVGKAISSFLSS